MDKGMALKQRGETWRIPAADEMQAIWSSTHQGDKEHSTRQAPDAQCPKHNRRDSVFAQQQAARISRQLISLQETAVKLFNQCNVTQRRAEQSTAEQSIEPHRKAERGAALKRIAKHRIARHSIARQCSEKQRGAQQSNVPAGG